MTTEATRKAMAAWATAGIPHIDSIAAKRDIILKEVSERLLDPAFLGSPQQIKLMDEARRYDTTVRILEDIRAGRFDV